MLGRAGYGMSTLTTLLATQAELEAGLHALLQLDPVMERLVAQGARPALRRRPPGFEGLAWIVVGQQLSTASAEAIWARLKARFPRISPADIAGASDEELRALGLSRPKVRTLRAIAAATGDGGLPLETLHHLGADDAHAMMTRVRGVGPWTADIYLLFCLGHADAFPAGDLAVQEAARIAYGLPARPRDKELLALAERWRPWRGVAAKVLWAFYRIARSREGGPMAG